MSKSEGNLLAKRVLIIVQNLPVPLDRRVWMECLALRERGYQVSVICPKGPDDPARQELEGVRIYKYAPPPEAEGLLGFAVEFAYCWMRTAWLSLRAWRDAPFQVIQACNPPDTYWLLGRLWRARGVRFVFDHHDLNPELYLSRFGKPTSLKGRLEFAALRWLERRTFAAAEQVISTNESYRSRAIERGGLAPGDVTVVRSGPDTAAMRPIVPAQRNDKYLTLAYLGIMGPQDGVDTVLAVMDELVNKRGRTDVRAVLMGFGDCLEDLRTECTQRGLDAVVRFTGRVDKQRIAEELSAADIGLCPDLRTPLNDVSTMNKTMEYMAYALPSVSFDLVETRVSGSDTVLYVDSGDVAGFADQVERLLDDSSLRVEMGLRARERVVQVLDWRPQASAYVGVYDRMFGAAGELVQGESKWTPRPGALVETDEWGRGFVDTANAAEFREYVEHRGRF